jgi:hypothetical protein
MGDGRAIVKSCVWGDGASFRLLSGLLGFHGFDPVPKAGAMDDLGQLLGPV